MKAGAVVALVAVGVGAAVLAFALTSRASLPGKVTIQPFCRYRWTWEARPAVSPALMQGMLHGANSFPGVQNAEASSTKDATRLVLDVASHETPAHDVQPGKDTIDFGGLRLTLISVTQLDCE